MKDFYIVLAALLIAGALVYHAEVTKPPRYELRTLAQGGTHSYDNRTGLPVRCTSEYGCESFAVRERRVLEAAGRREKDK